VKLNIELALIIDKALQKQGYIRLKKVIDPDFSTFTEEELQMVESLELTNVSSLEGLQKLPNLKKLVITSPDFSKVSIDLELQDSNINTITDFSIINELKGLEELHIVNDISIFKLDISNLENLKRIRVINNPHLNEIVGLESKRKLEDIMIYGNAITTPFDIDTYIKNTRGAKRNILDVSMYISMVNKDLDVAKMLSTSFLVGDTTLRFAERIGFLDFAVLSPEHLEKMYVEMSKLFMKNSLYDKSDAEKVKYVYRYVKNRLTFDKEGLEERQREYDEYRRAHGTLPEFRRKKFASFHNSYVAYHLKKANCDGYVNLMRFMLNMLNVQSFNVHCRDRRSSILSENHSILRVKCDGEWFYCNPQYLPDNPKEVFLGKMEDLEPYFEFNIYEKLVNKGDSYGHNNAKDSEKRVK